MDYCKENNNNEPIKSSSSSKGPKDTFIFGSWKCRNSKNKSRVASKDVITSKTLDRDKLPYAKKDAHHHRHQNSLPSSSTSTNCSSYYGCDNNTDEQQCEINVPPLPTATTTTRRVVSALYDQHLQPNELDEFWCPRCNGKMEEPRLLDCLHSVCSDCVNELTSKDHYESSLTGTDGYDPRPRAINIRRQVEGCPICDFPLPKYGSAAPPPHYSLQHRLVIYAVRRRLSQRAICCDTCADEVQATQHCPTCLCNFCQDCGLEHETQYRYQQLDPGRPHAIRPLWEAKHIRRVAVCLDHPAHPLLFHCIACQQVTCKECMWRGQHRGHASEEAASAGARAAIQLGSALRKARKLLNGLLTEYSERVFEPDDDNNNNNNNNENDDPIVRSRTAFDMARDSLPRPCHTRSRSTISSHSREARERIQEFSRLRRARYLIDAIFIGEDLLANGSDVEILSLKRIIMKRLKFLGVPIDTQAQYNSLRKPTSKSSHSGIFHCCTFCSSGGRKEATCACSGTMPGGYRGCGHGHPGHPGAHHWSCCGSIYRDGTCLLPQKRTFKITL